MATVARAPVAALPDVSMSQSGLMVAALIGGFIVYLAMQGKLGTYWTLMTGGGGSSAASTASPAATTTSPSATTTSPASTTATTANPFGLPSSAFPMLGGTAAPTAAGSGTVGFNALSPGAFSGLTSGGLQLFSGGS